MWKVDVNHRDPGGVIAWNQQVLVQLEALAKKHDGTCSSSDSDWATYTFPSEAQANAFADDADHGHRVVVCDPEKA